MKLRTDIPKERRNNLLMALFVLLFFVTAVKCTSQTVEVKRQAGYDSYLEQQTTTIFPKTSLSFDSPINKKDTIFLSIMVDSIRPSGYTVNLYAYFPRNTNFNETKNVTLFFADESWFTFYVTEKDETGYVVYHVDLSTLKKLTSTPVYRVAFDKIGKGDVSYNKNFFTSFFNSF
jgi:hypothetical protein